MRNGSVQSRNVVEQTPRTAVASTSEYCVDYTPAYNLKMESSIQKTHHEILSLV